MKKATLNLAEGRFEHMIYQEETALVKFFIFERPDSGRREDNPGGQEIRTGGNPCHFRPASPAAVGAAFPGTAVVSPSPRLFPLKKL